VVLNLLMKTIYQVAEFLWKLRMRLRFGELSRAPLQLLRFEMAAESATCEWLSRDADPWDSDLPPTTRDANATLQALLDAIALRQMLFSSIPEIREAKFRVYRQLESHTRELIITGLVSKDDAPPQVGSLVMRAKLYGFHFSIQEGVLAPLQPRGETLQFAM
jgi:hypothetical protein